MPSADAKARVTMMRRMDASDAKVPVVEAHKAISDLNGL